MSVFTKLALATVLPLLAHAATSSLLIHPGSDTTQCLGVASPVNDAPTAVVSCAAPGGALVNWLLAAGDNLSVQLAGTNFCLDAGTGPHNNGPAKVYTCYPGTAQQHWYYTDDQHLAITGGTQCLDRTSGTGAPQTYQCTGGDTNQIFSTSPGSVTTSSTTSPTSTSTSTPLPTATCQIGKSEILYPAPGTNLTQLYGGQGDEGNAEFIPFRFCSGQYFKTSSRNIQVALTNGQLDGIVIAELTSNGSLDGGYVGNLSVYPIDGNKPTFNTLLVLETYNDYYVPLGLTSTSIPITF